MNSNFDYVIVGAGTAGCVLASRLSEHADKRVLLLEAGPNRRGLWLRVPIGYFKTIFDPALGWGYQTAPQKHLNNRQVPWPRGKVLGGTGAINGLVYIRGQSDDYDAWRQMGNDGWGYADILPYFLKSEAQIAGNHPVQAKIHGYSGPLSVSDYPDRHPLCEAFISAAKQVGIPPNTDFNGGDQFGAGYYQINVKNGLRADTATAFLGPARNRKNLTIITDATVSKLHVEHAKARSVEFMIGGETKCVTANLEIILAAGAINSPQILQLSGIGDPAHLAMVGISPVHALPGVGKNLQDHLQVQLSYRCKQPISLNDEFGTVIGKARQMLRYILHRTGPIAGGPAPAGAFARSPDSMASDLQFHFMPMSLSTPGVLDAFSGFTIAVNQSRPHSRGDVLIGSTNPETAPVINPNYLDQPKDREVLLNGIKLARKIAIAPAFAPYFEREARPGASAANDQELVDYIRARASSIYHPVGTCRMGMDENAVVDPSLRVRGIAGLRVADASVMPTITSGNTNAPTIMIAEKAADLIKAAAISLPAAGKP